MFCLSKSEIRRVLGAINLDKYVFGRRDYLLILFLYHTGLRVGEVSGLTVGLVSHDTGAVTLRLREPRNYLHLPAAICKGSRGRVVPLNEVAQECVRKILTFNNQLGLSEAPEAPLFNNRVGGHLSVRSIQQLIALYRDAAGLDVRATPHTLRHSNASHLVAARVPTVHVQKLLGHRQLSSTQVYVTVSKEELAQSSKALE